MDTPISLKLGLIFLGSCIAYFFKMNLDVFRQIIDILQGSFMALMILSLRTSLLSFYRMNNTLLGEFHPKYINPQYLIKKFSYLNLKIFMYSNFSFLEKRYIKFYENDQEVIRLLNGIHMAHGEVEDLHRKPYYLLATYSMKQCIDFAMWSLLFTIMNVFLIFI